MPRRDRTPGWGEVLLVATGVVAGVLALSFGTSLLPREAQDLVFRTPLLIVVLAVATVVLLALLTRRSSRR